MSDPVTISLEPEVSPAKDSICHVAERLRLNGGDGFKSQFMYEFNGYMYHVDVVLLHSESIGASAMRAVDHE